VARHSDDGSVDHGRSVAAATKSDDEGGSLDLVAVAMLASFDGEEHKHTTR
jgi:hypothetical protein